MQIPLGYEHLFKEADNSSKPTPIICSEHPQRCARITASNRTSPSCRMYIWSAHSRDLARGWPRAFCTLAFDIFVSDSFASFLCHPQHLGSINTNFIAASCLPSL